ncbi:MAG: hypothetical protein WA964_04275 [Ilumatobacter sp.]|uniref:hypothetical protein n=1 Tax=Ilumatobacter sp. TaxID=1967498 RepID=UPI003C70BF2D
MTASTSATALETAGPVESGSPKSRSRTRMGIAGLAIAIKGQRAFDSRVDFPNEKIDGVLTVAPAG